MNTADPLTKLAAKRVLMDSIVVRYVDQSLVGSPEAWRDLCYLCLHIGTYTAIRLATIHIEDRTPEAEQMRQVALMALRQVRESLAGLRLNGIGWEVDGGTTRH